MADLESTGSVPVGRYELEVALRRDADRLARRPRRSRPAGAGAAREAGAARRDHRAETAEEAAARTADGLELLTDILKGAVLEPQRAIKHVDLLLELMQRLDDEGRRADALRVARAVNGALALAMRWADLVRSLRTALHAAEKLGAKPAIGWAHHELGTLHLAADYAACAERHLAQARTIRKLLGDKEGLAATEHNLGYLCRQLCEMVHEARLPPDRWGARRALVLAAVMTLCFFIAVAVATAIVKKPHDKPELIAWVQGQGRVRDVLPARADDRAGHHLPLGRAHDLLRLELLEKPFDDVLIHSTLLNPEGRRMSRTLGTGIDPEDALEPYGADATRYGLIKVTSTQDARFSLDSIEEGRRLAIKLWNVARLILANAGDAQPEAAPRELEERWILARLDAARAELEECLGRLDLAPATAILYHLTFDDFCDWYAEAIKPRLYEGDEAAVSTALAALERLSLSSIPSCRTSRRKSGHSFPAGRRGSSCRRGRRRIPRSPTMRSRSTACRRRRKSSAGAEWKSTSAPTTSVASSQPSSGPIVPASTATATPRSTGYARRSRARRACSRTSASSRTRPARSWTRSARSSSATAASSPLSAASSRGR